MLARRGSSTRIPGAHPRAELVGAARPLRRSQGHRNPGAPPRGRRTAPTQSPPRADLGRPRVPQRAEQAAAHTVAPTTAGVASNAAALARPARCPTLDLPAPTTRPTTYPTAGSGPWCYGWPRESPLGPLRVASPRPVTPSDVVIRKVTKLRPGEAMNTLSGSRTRPCCLTSGFRLPSRTRRSTSTNAQPETADQWP